MTRDHLALVHLARSRLKMDEHAYRAMLLRVAQVDSSKDLDAQGFAAVMKEFARLGFVSSSSAPKYGKRPGRGSVAQVDAVRRMFFKWAGAPDERALDRWLESSYGISSLRFATVPQCAAAMEALNQMLDRKFGPRPAAGSTSKENAHV